MTGTQHLIIIILVELVVIVGLILGVVLFVNRRRHRREKAAADRLATQVKREEPDRDQELRDILQQRFGFSGEALEGKVQEMMRAERQFYRHFLDLYLNRDPDAAEQLPAALQEVIQPYRDLEPTMEAIDGGDGTDAGTPSHDADSQATEDSRASPLRGDKELMEEIQLYRQTLNNLFAEYTAMFGISQDSNRDLTAQEIRERLESGRLAGPEDEN